MVLVQVHPRRARLHPRAVVGLEKVEQWSVVLLGGVVQKREVALVLEVEQPGILRLLKLLAIVRAHPKRVQSVAVLLVRVGRGRVREAVQNGLARDEVRGLGCCRDWLALRYRRAGVRLRVVVIVIVLHLLPPVGHLDVLGPVVVRAVEVVLVVVVMQVLVLVCEEVVLVVPACRRRVLKPVHGCWNYRVRCTSVRERLLREGGGGECRGGGGGQGPQPIAEHGRGVGGHRRRRGGKAVRVEAMFQHLVGIEIVGVHLRIGTVVVVRIVVPIVPPHQGRKAVLARTGRSRHFSLGCFD
mmetsp:Transcript_20322/g.51329  ORF Transcript_20322/g.51329 Transcript_20322/m.51329 type:complete len:298 (+) Transcript_20322:1135-2028(+)